MRYSYLILFVLFVHITAFSQKMDFLPKKNLWNTQSLDPIASQSFGQVTAVWEDGVPADYALTSFTFGFQKSFFAWQFSEDKAFDIGLEGSAITQFEWARRDGDFQRNIVSTDFLIGLPLVLHIKPWTFRLRIYHLSAHMGDDYMIRNKINSYVYNNNNYEQIDFTTSYLLKSFRFYLGIGVVIRSTNSRAPMVFTGGLDYLLPLNKKKSAQLYAGFYIDSKQEFDYRPAVNLGIGVQLGKPDRRPIKILFTYFNGPKPYSVYHGELVQWLGAAIYINPF